MKEKLLKIVAVLSFLGVLVTAYLIKQHYAAPGAAFCNVSEFVSCDVVNKSIYSELFGIPVSILGFLTYVALFFASLGLVLGWKFEKIALFLTGHVVVGLLTILTGIGLAFSLYLTYIEFFVLHAICIFCVTQQTLIFFIFLLLLFVWKNHSKSERLS